MLNKITEKKVDENVRFSKVTFNWTFARKQRNWELKVFNLKFVKKVKIKIKVKYPFVSFSSFLLVVRVQRVTTTQHQLNKKPFFSFFDFVWTFFLVGYFGQALSVFFKSNQMHWTYAQWRIEVTHKGPRHEIVLVGSFM